MSFILLEALEKHLEWAEGIRKFPYEDSVGKISIGIGRNLDDVGLSDSEIRVLLKNDIDRAVDEAHSFDFYENLSGVRKLVILDMLFNMGRTKFLRFRKFIEALRANDWEKAAEEMVDSRWYEQVGRRAVKLVEAMRRNIWE